MNAALLAVGPFGGVDVSSEATYVGDNRATDALNVVGDRQYNAYNTVKGRVDAGITGLPGTPLSITRSVDNVGPFFLFLVAGGIWFSRAPGVASPLALPPGAVLQGAGKFVSAKSWIFLSTNAPNDTPLKIRVYDRQVTNWGIVPPTTAPVPSLFAVGPLNFAGYQYRVTYGVQLDGVSTQESSPGPSSPVYAATNQAVVVTIPVSPDPQVNERTLYRLDSGGTYRAVGQILENTSTSFVDQTPDTLVTGQSLITHRDPPYAFVATEFHQDSLWGFGWQTPGVPATLSDLVFSNVTEPWGYDLSNQFLPVGENASGDVAVGLASTGSVLACLKTHSFWGVFGDSTNDYFVQKLFDIGCVAPKSIAKAQGVTYWLAGVQGVYSFGGSSPQYLSADIKRFLNENRAVLPNCVGFFRGRSYFLSFPDLGITWQLDTNSNQWWKLGFATTAAYYDLDDASVSAGLVACASGGPAVHEWFAAETDLGMPIASYYTTKIADGDEPEAVKLVRYATISAPVQPARCALVVTTDPGPTQRTYLKWIDLSVGPEVRTVSLPSSLRGRTMQFQISVSSSAQTVIRGVKLFGAVKRRLSKK